jgi:hypothetical protein
MESICLPRDVNATNDVSVGALKTLSSGGKMGYVSHKDNKLVFQTPEMYAPFGVSEWVNEQDGSKKYDLQLSFKDLDDRETLKQLKKFLEDVDEKVIEEAFNNCQKWFGKKYKSKDVVSALFNESVKYYKDPETGDRSDKYPANYKLKLPYRDNEFKVEAYDGKRNKLDIQNTQTMGAKVTALVECGGVWVIGGKFGISWRVIQLQVKPKQTISGFSFKQVEEDTIEGDDDIDEVTNGVGSSKLDDSKLDDSDHDDI